MKHPTAWPLLDHFLDCSLETETRWAVAAHLAECVTCQAYLAEQARMHTFIRNRLSRVAIPEGLAERIQTTVREAEPRPALFRWPRLWHITLVAASLAILLLVVFGWWFLSSSTRGPDLVTELATSHNLFARDDTLLEVTGTQVEILAWFRDKVSFPVMTPDLPGYTLLGGRLVAINAQRAVQLVYENEPVRQYLSLVYFEPPLSEQSRLKSSVLLKAGQSGDTAIVTWPGKQADMALVANLPVADLLRLAEQMGNK